MTYISFDIPGHGAQPNLSFDRHDRGVVAEIDTFRKHFGGAVVQLHHDIPELFLKTYDLLGLDIVHEPGPKGLYVIGQNVFRVYYVRPTRYGFVARYGNHGAEQVIDLRGKVVYRVVWHRRLIHDRWQQGMDDIPITSHRYSFND